MRERKKNRESLRGKEILGLGLEIKRGREMKESGEKNGESAEKDGDGKEGRKGES